MRNDIEDTCSENTGKEIANDHTLSRAITDCLRHRLKENTIKIIGAGEKVNPVIVIPKKRNSLYSSDG